MGWLIAVVLFIGYPLFLWLIATIGIAGMRCFLTGGHKGEHRETPPYERICDKCGNYF